MMQALKIAWATQTKGCIPENSKVKEFEEHNTRQFNRIYTPFSHCFCFNLTWTGKETS